MTIAQEIQEMRAKKKAQTRNERAAENALDYRDGYAAAFADYTSSRNARDIADVVGLTENHLKGYGAGYADASRGKARRWPHHAAPTNIAAFA